MSRQTAQKVLVFSAAVVSALILQMIAETINPKVWSLSAETYSDLSSEILLPLTFLC